MGVDMSQLDEATYHRLDGENLEKSVVVRLVQDGFALVSVTEAPHVKVKYLRGEALHILASTADKTVVEEVSLVDLANQEALHLEIAQRTVELVRQLVPASSADVAQPQQQGTVPNNAAPAIDQVNATKSTEEPASDWQARFELSASGGMAHRGKVDPLFGVGLRAQFSRPLALTARLALVPASSDAVDVFEWQPQVGLAWSPLHTQDWRLSLGLEVGALFHHFTFERDSGTRVDVLVSLPLALHWFVSESFAIGLRIAGGLSEESREHQWMDAVVWERSNLRFETALELALQF